MAVPSLAGRQRGHAAAPPETNSIEALVRRLVAAARVPLAAPGTSREEDVLVDLEVDGVRYLLIRRPPPRPAAGCSLSPRELEISRMVAKGYVNKTIAGVLDISCYTVDTYLRRIFAKLNVTSRAAMVARLSEEGQLAEPLLNGLPNTSAAGR